MGYFVDTSERNVCCLDTKIKFSFFWGASLSLASQLLFTSNTETSAAFIFRVLLQEQINETEY